MKRILPLLIALALLATIPLSVCAHDYVDLSKKGSITLTLNYDGAPITGGRFTCVRVADVMEYDGNYCYQMLLEGQIYTDAASIPSAEEIYRDTVLNNTTFFEDYKITHTNQTGTVTFLNLQPGLYLIINATAIPGYSQMNPFLVSLPYLEDGTYLYDVNASVKSELEKEPEPTTAPTSPSGSTPTTPSKLPQTGQLTWPVPVMASTGMLLIAIGWALCFGKKKDDYEA